MQYVKPKFYVINSSSDYLANYSRVFGPKCDLCEEPMSDHEPPGFIAYAGHGLLSCTEILCKKLDGEVLELHTPDANCTSPECLVCGLAPEET